MRVNYILSALLSAALVTACQAPSAPELSDADRQAINASLVALGSIQDQTGVQEEVERLIREEYAYVNQNGRDRPGGYSSQGTLEFWSNGGLMQEIGPNPAATQYDSIQIQPKHIRVVPLAEGVVVAQFYAEGSMTPSGSSAVPHYVTRATVVYVQESGEWKIRAAHYSPVTGGSGTSQAVLQMDR